MLSSLSPFSVVWDAWFVKTLVVGYCFVWEVTCHRLCPHTCWLFWLLGCDWLLGLLHRALVCWSFHLDIFAAHGESKWLRIGSFRRGRGGRWVPPFQSQRYITFPLHVVVGVFLATFSITSLASFVFEIHSTSRLIQIETVCEQWHRTAIFCALALQIFTRNPQK